MLGQAWPSDDPRPDSLSPPHHSPRTCLQGANQMWPAAPRPPAGPGEGRLWAVQAGGAALTLSLFPRMLVLWTQVGAGSPPQ